MSGEDDLSDDVLPMVLSGLPGPRYLAGRDREEAAPDEDSQSARRGSGRGSLDKEAAITVNRSQRGKP